MGLIVFIFQQIIRDYMRNMDMSFFEMMKDIHGEDSSVYVRYL